MDREKLLAQKLTTSEEREGATVGTRQNKGMINERDENLIPGDMCKRVSRESVQQKRRDNFSYSISMLQTVKSISLPQTV
jgi:hypothetical protein